MIEEKKTKTKITGTSLLGYDVGTCYGMKVTGKISKINNISENIKKIILEGILSDIKVYKINIGGHIVAKLNDDTGSINIVMMVEGKNPFRKLVSLINEKAKYRIYGIVSYDSTFYGIDTDTIPKGTILIVYNIENVQ